MMRSHRTTDMMAGLVLFLSASGLWAQDWPQWRGPHRDNRVTGFSAPATWPKALTEKWKVSVGIGESSPVMVGERLYVFGRQDGNEVTRCLDAASGKEIWVDKYPAAEITGPARGYPGPRSTPAVGEGKVCTLGVHGVVSCLDAATGKLVWRKETGSKPQFYTSTSPLIVDGKCIVFVGALTAFDLKDGEARWKWTGATAPYGSPVLATIEGTRQVVTPASGVLAGISLADGKGLWQVEIGAGFDYQSNYSTPLIDGAMVYYSAAAKAKTAASMFALKIEKKEDRWNAALVWKNSKAAHGYHAPLLKDGRIYGVSLAGRNFFCLDAKTGNELWVDKATQRGQCGSILDVGPVLLSLTSDQRIVVFKASDKEYEEVANYSVPESWCVPIVAGSRIFVKDKAGSLTLWTLN